MKVNEIISESLKGNKVNTLEILNKFPELEKTNDLNEVVGWFYDANINDLEFYFDNEPMEMFAPQAIEMESTFDEFPEDAKRANKIATLLKQGKEPLPIFVEYDDPHNFIIEGRHRIVAFMQIGYDSIPVIRVKDKRPK